MLVVELFADTIPGIDSIWDVIHTVIRVPAGSALAASVLGGRDASPSWPAGHGAVLVKECLHPPRGP